MAFWRPFAVASLVMWGTGIAAVACNLTSGLTGGPPLDGGPEEAASDAAADALLERAGDAGLDAKHDAEASPCMFTECPSGQHSVPTCADAACGLVCIGTFANCDEDASNGCEVDIATDPQNCNACGHSCQGGVCEAGACQPVTLCSASSAPTHIAIDPTFIYGVNGDGTVLRLEKAGDGGDIDALASVTSYSPQDTPVPPRIAIDDNAVYWTVFSLAQSLVPPSMTDGGALEGGSTDSGVPGAILAVPIDGGATSVLAVAQQPYAVSAQSGSVFWSEGDPNVLGRDGTIHACAVSSSPPGAPISCAPQPNVASAAGRVYGVLAYEGKVLFPSALFTEAGVAAGGGSITQCMAQLSDCTPLVSSLVFPYSVASDPASSPSQNVYFTLFAATGSIGSCPGGVCANMETPLDDYQLQPRFLASDGTNVYFGTLDGAIKSVPAAGGSEHILYQLHGMDPWDIAVDSTSIYWTSLAGSVDSEPTLRRLAK
jgi:hypothetical protein